MTEVCSVESREGRVKSCFDSCASRINSFQVLQRKFSSEPFLPLFLLENTSQSGRVSLFWWQLRHGPKPFNIRLRSASQKYTTKKINMQSLTPRYSKISQEMLLFLDASWLLLGSSWGYLPLTWLASLAHYLQLGLVEAGQVPALRARHPLASGTGDFICV